MYVDGDWVKKQRNHIGRRQWTGRCCIMSILESTDIAHPAIEALYDR